MPPNIRPLVAPLVGLRLEIGQVLEGAERPEIVPDVVHGPLLHLPLFLRLRHIAGKRGDVQGPQKFQKMLVEAHQGPLPLQDRGKQVVMNELFGSAVEKVERIEEAAMPGVLPLRVRKLQREQAAMRFNHGQAVELAGGVTRGERAEMAPVGLTLHTRCGFEAEDGWLLFAGVSHAVQVIPHNGDPTVEALLREMWANDHGRGLRVDLQQAGDLVFEGLELAGPENLRPLWIGLLQVFCRRWSADAEGLGDLTHGEACMRQAVEFEDGAFVNHGLLPESDG